MHSELSSDLRRSFDSLKNDYRSRDIRHSQVAAARRGDIRDVMPGVFPDNWPRPIVANVIDTTAKEYSQVLAKLPSIDCAPGKAGSEAAKKFAAKRTKIALSYVESSRLKHQAQSGSDWYFTFGAMPIVTEANVFQKMPCMRIDDPRGAYWRTDAYGTVKLYAKEWQESCGSLCAKFPELAEKIVGKKVKKGLFGLTKEEVPEHNPDELLTVVRMYTKEKTYLWMPEQDGLILTSAKNFLGRVPVEIAELPRWDDESRGTFDDVVWVWLARNRMALFRMEATKKAIQAPVAAPHDVQRIPMGSDAVLRSNEPDKIRRVGLEIPQSVLADEQILQGEVQMGLNKQASATNFDASIVTGRGIEALNGVFSSQIASAQDEVGEALRRSLMNCFELDEILWPGEQKTVSGMANGAPFTETYVPSKDIKGNFTLSVTYGFTAGMDPNRALVWLLQLRGDRAIDRATLQRSLPMETDVEGLGRDIDLERLDDAALAGLEGMLANLPLMAQQGMDPTSALRALSVIRKARQKGTPVGEALEEAFAKPEPPPGAAPEQDPLAALMGAAGGGAPPEEAAMGGGGGAPVEAGGPESLQMMLAGLTGAGNPQLQAGVSRQIPA